MSRRLPDYYRLRALALKVWGACADCRAGCCTSAAHLLLLKAARLEDDDE